MKKINLAFLLFAIFGFLFFYNPETVNTVCYGGIPNGSVQAGEECDPGVPSDTLSCDYDGGTGWQACTVASCGDGYVNSAAGEVCDDGVNNGQPGGFLFTDWSQRIAGIENTSPVDAVATYGNYVFAVSNGNINVINISNPTDPQLITTYTGNPGYAQEIFISGNYAYVADLNEGLHIMNISTPTNPVATGSFNTPGFSSDVVVSGNYAYVADRNSLQIIDISTPTSPAIVGVFDDGQDNDIYGVAVVGNRAYITNGAVGMHIVDVSNPSSPSLIGTYNSGGFFNDVFVEGGSAYVATSIAVEVVDITNETNPTQAGIINGEATDIKILDDIAYTTAGDDGFKIIDMSDNVNPRLMGVIETNDTTHSLVVEDDYAYVAGGNDGFLIIDISDAFTPVLTNRVSATEGYNVIDIENGIAYLSEVNGYTNYLKIFDLSTPNNPTPLTPANFTLIGGTEQIKVLGDYLYSASIYYGLQVYRISDPANPVWVGECDDDWGALPYCDGLGLGIDVVGNYAYLATGVGGLNIIDISDPEDPQWVSVVATENAVSVVVEGDYAYVGNYGTTGLNVINIADKQNPFIQGQYGVPESFRGIDVVDDNVYHANGYLGMRIFDVSNHTAPQSISLINTPTSVRNLAVYGPYVFIADLNNMQVINAADPANPSFSADYYNTGVNDSVRDLDIFGDYVYAVGNIGMDIIRVRDSSIPNYCNDTCTDITPSDCGNALVEYGEQCDDGQLNDSSCTAMYGQICSYCSDGNDGNNSCSTQFITGSYCGDGIINSPFETCDDGNNTNVGTCNSTCDGPTTCGDGTLQTPNGEGLNETCDDGDVTDNGTCNAACTALTVCGDSITQTPNGYGVNEVCDDGDNTDNGLCNASCTGPTTCGDGIVQTPNGNGVNEICDDGNNTNEGLCNASCTGPTTCGDGTIQSPNGEGGLEECETPGSMTPFGVCSSECRFPACGNNVVDSGEECDEWTDENPANPDTATCDWDGGDGTNACTFNVCGTDGYLNDFEVCDPSAPVPFGGTTCASLTAGDPVPRPSGNLSCITCNAIDTTGCYSCGNGIIEGPELCDDGNLTSGDGCENTCFAFSPGWSCSTNPAFDGDGNPAESVCALLCGNGNPSDPGEVCDDGNNIDETIDSCTYGAGSCSFCNSDCSAILNFTPPYCGDNNIDTIDNGPDGIPGNADDNVEACDLGAGRNNDPNCEYGLTTCTACVSNCSIEQAGITSYCGDNSYDPANEECDYDTFWGPPVDGDGCSAACTIETGYVCAVIEGTYQCVFSCGNGVLQTDDPYNESCDAGTDNGLRCEPNNYGENCDWCTSACESRTVVGDYCGDGEINAPYEECDQGNTVSGDGCSALCQVEAGWNCVGNRDSVCSPVSGDGICIGAPYETCTNNFNDCGACSIGDILTALPGQTSGVFNSIVDSISNIFPIPQLRINIPGLNLNRARVSEPLQAFVDIGASLFGPQSRTPVQIGNVEKFITIDAIDGTDGSIDITFE